MIGAAFCVQQQEKKLLFFLILLITSYANSRCILFCLSWRSNIHVSQCTLLIKKKLKMWSVYKNSPLSVLERRYLFFSTVKSANSDDQQWKRLNHSRRTCLRWSRMSLWVTAAALVQIARLHPRGDVMLRVFSRDMPLLYSQWLVLL